MAEKGLSQAQILARIYAANGNNVTAALVRAKEAAKK